MNRRTRNLIIPGAACLSGTLLALLGCQQETTPNATGADIRPEYALEVQKLKAGPEGSFDAGLAALDAKFGYPTASAEAEKPREATDALGKAAAAQVFTATGDCARIFKNIFKASPGDQVIFGAQSLNVNNTGVSDPVALLIQFNHPDFIQNGVVPTVTQADFRILSRSDDVAPGNLSAHISYTFPPGESGYFMVMAIPYSNAHSGRYVSMSLDFVQPSCPHCDVVIQNPVRKIGGLVYQSAGANDFRANRATDQGDPRIYVIMNTLGLGMSNGNANFLTKNSKVFPFFVSANDGLKPGNVVFIDNEAAGTASITHTQFSP